MSIFSKLFKKQVDERQELELLKAEHTAYWVTFWLLFIAITVERFILQVPLEQMMAEWCIFMISCIVLCVGCIRKGLWCFQTKKVPGVKAYIGYSLCGAAIGVVFGIITVIQFEIKEIPIILAIIGMDAFFIFISCFVLFLIVGSMAKSREKKLADKAMLDDEDDLD